MRFQNIHVIFYSPTHTSARIAHAIVEGMNITAYHETDITCQAPDKVEHLGDEFTIVAVPVYGGRVAETAVQRLRMFKGENTPVVPVVLYGNRDYEDALLELCDLLREQGFVPFAAGAFIGEHTFSRPGFPIAEGRPDASDLEIATRFGLDARHKLESVFSFENYGELPVKGNRPYKEKRPATPQAPVTDKAACTQCGHCTEVCPVGAITLHDDGAEANPQICTKCCACVRECPAEALSFDTPYTAMLHKNFSARREPELFF